MPRAPRHIRLRQAIEEEDDFGVRELFDAGEGVRLKLGRELDRGRYAVPVVILELGAAAVHHADGLESDHSSTTSTHYPGGMPTGTPGERALARPRARPSRTGTLPSLPTSSPRCSRRPASDAALPSSRWRARCPTPWAGQRR